MNQIKQLLNKYRTERDKYDFLIRTLESELSGAGATVPHTAKKGGRQPTGNSIPALAKRVLELAGIQGEGLTVPNIIAEITKLGYQTDSKNPANSVNSTLHKAAKNGEPFVRVRNKWYLKKYAPADSAPLADAIRNVMNHESPPTPAGKSGAPTPNHLRRVAS
jgi:hypothetical protein